MAKVKAREYAGLPIEFDPQAVSEHHLQVRFMVKCEDHLTEYPELWAMHATPNGGKRQRLTAVLLKAEGVKKGVPDVFLPVPRGGYHGWWCEFKFNDGRPSPEQEAWITFLRAQGYYVCVYWSAEAAFRDLLAYLDAGRVVLLREWPAAHAAARHLPDCGIKYRGCAPNCPQAAAAAEGL